MLALTERMLTNLETSKEKLLQIVLAGQPELANKLDHPCVRQLKQRIALRYRLKSLTFDGRSLKGEGIARNRNRFCVVYDRGCPDGEQQ